MEIGLYSEDDVRAMEPMTLADLAAELIGTNTLWWEDDNRRRAVLDELRKRGRITAPRTGSDFGRRRIVHAFVDYGALPPFDHLNGKVFEQASGFFASGHQQVRHASCRTIDERPGFRNFAIVTYGKDMGVDDVADAEKANGFRTAILHEAIALQRHCPDAFHGMNVLAFGTLLVPSISGLWAPVVRSWARGRNVLGVERSDGMRIFPFVQYAFLLVQM